MPINLPMVKVKHSLRMRNIPNMTPCKKVPFWITPVWGIDTSLFSISSDRCSLDIPNASFSHEVCEMSAPLRR